MAYVMLSCIHCKNITQANENIISLCVQKCIGFVHNNTIKISSLKLINWFMHSMNYYYTVPKLVILYNMKEFQTEARHWKVGPVFI